MDHGDVQNVGWVTQNMISAGTGQFLTTHRTLRLFGDLRLQRGIADPFLQFLF